MSKSKFMALLSLVAVLSMLLTACQPTEIVKTVVVTEVVEGKTVEKVVTATPAPDVAQVEAPAAAPKGEGKPVDTVVIGIQQEPDTLHYYLGEMSSRTYVNNLITVGCVGQNEKAEWIGLGCETAPTLENGGAKIVGEGDDKHLEVSYKIRDGWRWTDGVPVTAKDIIYWWGLMMDPEFPYSNRTAYEKIYDIKVIDDRNVVVVYMSKKQVNEAIKGTLTGNVNFKPLQADYQMTYGESWNDFLVDPTFQNIIGWLPEHILKDIKAADQSSSEYARKPLGDGPYVVKEWKAGQEIDLEKAELPFPLGEPKVQNVIFRFYGDASGILAGLKAGEIDAAAGNISALTEAEGPDLDAIEKEGNIKVDWIKGWDYEHIDLNTSKFPLDDVRVRQALAYAIDIDEINQAVYFGKKAITQLPLPVGAWAYPPDSEITTYYPYNPEKAAALLKDAGWDCSARPCTKKDKDGNDVFLSFNFMTTDRPSRMQTAQILAEQWKKINVEITLTFMPARNFFATCQDNGPLKCRTFDAGMYTFSSDDSATFYSVYSCTTIPTEENGWAGQNNPGWCNQKAMDAMNQSENNPEIAMSREKRMPYITSFFKELTADEPVIYLYNSQEPFPHLVGWKNFKPGPTQYSYFTWNSWEWEVTK